MSVNSASRLDLPSVVHCFRAPVGGVFRHVRDLAVGQAERGLPVGLVCDATTGGRHAQSALAELSEHCALGIHRVPMRRSVHLSDVTALRKLTRIFRDIRPAIVHGHGAKGGAFARLLPRSVGAKVVYTPHGGVLHYPRASMAGRCYFALERYLQRTTSGVIFESEFGRKKYNEKIGEVAAPSQVIHNGLRAEDFVPVAGATHEYQFVYVGELRKLKGLDTLLDAMAQLDRQRAATLLVCGDGPDRDYFAARVRALDLQDVVTTTPAVFPAAQAFARAQCVVIPSHAESFPYIVLEAAAACAPLIATSAGGIPEIVGTCASALVPPRDAHALAAAMARVLDDDEAARSTAQALASHVKEHFRVESMLDACVAFYMRVMETDR